MTSKPAASTPMIWRLRAHGAVAMIGLAALLSDSAAAQRSAEFDESGARRVQAFDLPISSLFDEPDRTSMLTSLARYPKSRAQFSVDYANCMQSRGKEPDKTDDPECTRDAGVRLQSYIETRERFPVDIAIETVAGVPVEIFTPRAGVAHGHQDRVLINLHGGGFVNGSRYASHLESLPIAALGGFQVVSVDYRLAPQVKFPAASEDVAAVYADLLRRYKPENIGIFGCSAGGLLTAETVAWLIEKKLPLPGAIAISGAGAHHYLEGDSGRFGRALEGRGFSSFESDPYFGPSAAGNPLAFPLLSNELMSRFPPTLILTSTRDLSLSSAVRTHQVLTRLGRETDLHVWEGQGHCFAAAGSNSPAANELWLLTIKFFDRHLGK